MKAGAKGTSSADPLEFTGWPKDRARRRELFIREYLLVPKGVGAGGIDPLPVNGCPQRMA